MADRRRPGDRIAGEVAEAVLRGIDLDAVVARIDLDAALARMDLDAALQRVDLDAVLARVDIDALLQRVDVDRIAARIDVDALSRRIPVGDLVSTADIQAAVDGVDLGPALRRAGLADIVAQSLGQSTMSTVRRRVVVLDALSERLSGSLMRQDVDSWPAGPEQLVGDETGPLGQLDGQLDGARAWDVTGHFVGPLGRVLATTLDVVGAVASWTLITSTLAGLVTSFAGPEAVSGTTAGIAWAIGLSLWIAGWFLLPLEVVGRTPAMSVLGMRVVTREGDVPRFRTLLLRSLVQAPAVLLLGVGYLPVLFDKRRRALHDLVAGTSVVWDWGAQEATIASPLGRWVARHEDVDATGDDPPPASEPGGPPDAA